MKALKSNWFLVFIMAVILASVYLTSCKTIKPGTDTIKTDQTNIVYVPVDVPVKGAQVGTSLNLDSLVKAAINARTKYLKDSLAAVLAGKPTLTPPPSNKNTVTDPQTKAQLTYWIDQFGKLQLTCESKDQTVTMLVAEVSRLSKEVTKKIEVIKETPLWNWIAISILATLLIISVLLNLLTIKRR